MRRHAFFGIFASSLLVVSCLDEKTTKTSDGTEQSTLTFQPSCGSPGDRVTVFMTHPSTESECGNYEVSFHPGEKVPAADQYRADGTTCRAVVVVPASARTGTLEAKANKERGFATPNLVSRDVFTVPCPPSDGGDGGVDGGDGGPNEKAPLGAVYNVVRSGTVGNFNGYFLGQTSPQQQADAEAGLANEAARITAPGVPVGSCGTPTPPPLPPSPVPGVSAGVITISNGGTPLTTVSPQTSDGDTFYDAIMSGTPANTSLDVTVQGTREFPAATVPAAIRTAPQLTITSPDLGGGQVLAPAGDLKIDFTPVQVTHMAITVQSVGGGAPKVCRVDPSAGTFTIPGSVMGASGTTTSVNVRIGNVVEKVVGGKRHVSISDSSINGLVSLQ